MNPDADVADANLQVFLYVPPPMGKNQKAGQQRQQRQINLMATPM
jgi:hypothetical protein